MGWAIRENGGSIGNFSYSTGVALGGSALVVSRNSYSSVIICLILLPKFTDTFLK
jgi:hypothetical protein